MRLRSRVRTTAAPEQVWAVLGDPQRWPDFDLTLRRVRGSAGPAARGQHLLGIARWWGLPVPLDVEEAVPERRLVLRVQAVPGVSSRVTTEIAPRSAGGCDVVAQVEAEGLFARTAIIPLWLTVLVTTRVLVVRAEQERRRSISGGSASASAP